MNHSDFTALDDDEVAACPYCDAAAVAKYGSDGIRSWTADTRRYTCHNCDSRFNSFCVREREAPACLKGMPRRLLNADPDEVSR